MADIVYDSFLWDTWNGLINPASANFYGMLVTSSYTPNQATHDKRDDVTNEVSGTGYTAGGKQITGITLTTDPVLHKVYLKGNVLSWPASTITARGLVVYVLSGSGASSDRLVKYFDFGSDKSSSNSGFRIVWNSLGILSYGG
jgi:hypothetical protein